MGGTRGGGGGCGVLANENSCAHHVTWSPNKLEFSYLIWVELTNKCGRPRPILCFIWKDLNPVCSYRRHMSLPRSIHQHDAWPDPISWESSFKNTMGLFIFSPLRWEIEQRCPKFCIYVLLYVRMCKSQIGWYLADWLYCLAGIANISAVHGSIPTSSNKEESMRGGRWGRVGYNTQD